MAVFGLACEGITDQIVIENVLCGFYDNPDLDQEIQRLQPPFDATTQQQLSGAGGWLKLCRYLRSKRFREDVLNSEYTVIQIDSDICEQLDIVINQPITDLITKIKLYLSKQIDSQNNFYSQHQEKIIFAISVHCTDCWLLPLFLSSDIEIIEHCKDQIQAIDTRKKASKLAQNLSDQFLNRQKLLLVAANSQSLHHFISTLPTELPDGY